MFRTKLLPLACASALVALSPLATADVKLTGQLNRAVMYADDGFDSDTFFVDNDNSSSRINIMAEHKFSDDFTAGGVFELEYESNSSFDVTMKQTGDATQTAYTNRGFNERKIEAFLKSKSAGTLWIGQGEMASDTVSEKDISGTSVAGFSLLPTVGGSLAFRMENGMALARGNRAGTAFSTTGTFLRLRDVTNNMDGLSRQDRVRYDTPSLGGLVLSASAATAEALDFAAVYNGKLPGLQLVAGVAYAMGGDQQVWDTQINGSISAAFDFGLTLTVAGGMQQFDDDSARKDDEPMFGYAKLGWKFGDAAVSGEYGITEDLAMEGDEYTMYGASFVYNLKKVNTELFLNFRNHSVDLMMPNGSTTTPEDMFTVLGGARVKF